MPVDKSADRVRTMFAEIADGYDRMNHLLSFQVDRYWRWRTVRSLPVRGTDPILDVCTGTGDLALAFFRHYQGRIAVIGTDFCPEMLAHGEAKKRRWGLDQTMQFREADTEQLPFPNDQFQLVTVAFGLRNVANTQRGLEEMTRVCRPGGHVAVLEFSLPRLQPFRALYGWYFRNILPRIGQFLMRNRQNAYNYLPQSVTEFPEGKAMLERLEQAGLRQCRETRFTLGVATLYVGQKPSASSPPRPIEDARISSSPDSQHSQRVTAS